MASKLKLTVSIDRAVARRLDDLVKSKRRARSALVEEAIRDWEQAQLRDRLKEGYLAMAEEDREFAEAALPLNRETLK
jgi:predicted transcriptional regulator